MKLVSWFVRAAGAAVTLGERLAGVLLVGIVLLIDVQIVTRFLGGRSLHITEEYSAYGMVAIVFLGSGYALLTDKHIRVSIIYERLGMRGKLWLDRIAHIVGFILLTILLLGFFEFFTSASRSGLKSITVARTPLSYPYGIALVGIALFWLSFLAQLIRLFTQPPRVTDREG